MKDRQSKIFLLFGAWVSFVAIVLVVTTFLPPLPTAPKDMQALLYRLAQNESLAQSDPVPSGRSILADLDAMTITLYDNHVALHTYPILSKGREGTFWETPTGNYEVGAKESKHFSSIGGTWMPYSLQFYGNFFIHGWPTYPDGTPVAKGYSGGCMRLDTDDAREVYAFASRGTRVSVVNGAPRRQFATSSQYYLRAPDFTGVSDATATTLPIVQAPSFIVADVDLGDVLWQRNANATSSAQNLVSLMTALTALETVNQYKLIRMGDLLLPHSVSRKKAVGAPDEISLGSLVYPLLYDGNDTAAKAFAREHGEKSFIAYMNQKANAIGMSRTEFGGALSIDESSTTARDLLTLITYVNAHKHFLIDVTRSGGRTFTATDGKTEFDWENNNPWFFAGDAGYQGGLGRVRADGSGNALLLFALPVSEFSSRTIALVVPESPTILEDVSRMRAFVLEHFVYGIERSATPFIREEKESLPSLFLKIKSVLDLEKLLQDNVLYEREV